MTIKVVDETPALLSEVTSMALSLWAFMGGFKSEFRG